MRKPLRQHVRMMDRGLHKQGISSCAARRVESKNLKERSCTSASSAERIGAFGYSVSLVPGGSAAGTAPSIGQERGRVRVLTMSGGRDD
jgi:hypothetical protein